MNDYEEYLKKYAFKHKITEEEASKHLLVRIVKMIYEAGREKNTSLNEGGGKDHA